LWNTLRIILLRDASLFEESKLIDVLEKSELKVEEMIPFFDFVYEIL